MAGSDLVFTVKAKTDSAAASFKKLATSILPVKKESDAAAASMAKINKTKVAPKVDTAQIRKVSTEINRLQQEMAKRLEADVTADTSDIRRKLTGLRSSLRELQRPKITPELQTSGLRTKITSALSSVTSGLQGVGSGISKVFSNVGVPLIGALGVAVTGVGVALGATGIKALSLADDMERAKLQLDSFTHSSETTVKLLNQVQGFADQSPFEFPELVSAAKRLLGVGIGSGKVVAQLKLLGDVAAQSGASVDDLGLIFSQMVSNGKVSAEDMGQLADRGIAAWPALAKAMGKSVAEVRKLGEQGKLGADEVQLLWDTLGKGAEGSTAALAGTLSGMISTLKDTVNGVLRDIGESLLPFAKVIVPQLTKGVEGIGDKVLNVMPKIIDMIAAGLTALLDLPGVILRGLAGVTQGFMGMVAGIQDSIAGLVRGIATALAGIPGISDEDVAGLRTAADTLEGAAKASREKGGQLFASMTAQAAKFDTAVRPLKGKIEEARKVAQQGLVLGVSIKAAETNVSKIKGTLAKLHKQKTTPQVKSDIRAAEANLKKARANLANLNRYKANPKILATDLASGKVKIVKGQLVTVPKEKRVKLTADDGVTHKAKTAGSAVRDIPRTWHTSWTVAVHRTGASSSAGGGPKGPLVPEINMLPPAPVAPPTPAPQVTIAVSDRRLADLLSLRIDQRAVRAARIIHRRDPVLL